MPSKFGPDSIDHFIHAAEQRYNEAHVLASNGFAAGAVYLYGYVVEMLIKAACFRLMGLPPTFPIEGKDRAVIAEDMKANNLATGAQHDLLGWAQWLVFRKPVLTSQPYPQPFGLAIIAQADVVHQLWHPDMRYRAQSVPGPDLLAVQTATDWVRTNFPQL
jgi:hypothetical protein